MKIRFLPGTVWGKCSVWLIVAFSVLFIVFQLLVAAGQRGGETFFDNLLLSLPIFLAALCGISSLITGLIALIRCKERSLLVFLSTFIGLLILVFILGELIFPH